MTRLDRLQARRLDENVQQAKLAGEFYRSLEQSDGVRYAIGAMQPIDPEYTGNTYIQGNRIRDSLLGASSVQACDYKYQGSVTNDTHIRAASDIDLVVIIKKFHWVSKPLVPEAPYLGDVTTEMRSLRDQCASHIRSNFSAVTVDNSGGKAISLSGGSLTRKVDVVPAGWLHTTTSREKGDDYKGIEIIDNNSGEKISNFPWLHNLHVQARNQETSGGLCKASRLMKSLKADSESPDKLSSYDIVAIAYNIPADQLSFTPPHELHILQSCREYCIRLRDNSQERNSILVPNKTRNVFSEKGANLKQLESMISELEGLISDIANDVRRPLTKLAEARIEHPSSFRSRLVSSLLNG